MAPPELKMTVHPEPEAEEDDDEPDYCPHGTVVGRHCWACGNIEQAEMRGEL